MMIDQIVRFGKFGSDELSTAESTNSVGTNNGTYIWDVTRAISNAVAAPSALTTNGLLVRYNGSLPFDSVVLNLSLIGHFRPMATGSVFVSDIGYFMSGTLLALFLTTRRLAER